MVERHERLQEALDIIEGLLANSITNYRGRHLQLDHAKLFDRPTRKPLVIVAAGGPDAAAMAARKADGLIVTEAKADLLKAYKKAGGKGPRYAEVGMCCARDEETGMKIAHKYFRWSVAGWPVMAEYPMRRRSRLRRSTCPWRPLVRKSAVVRRAPLSGH